MQIPTNFPWRWIVVNSSGGKDSQTALRAVVEACDAAGIDRSRIVVSHQCLGRMEWEGTKELVIAQAAHYGLRVEIAEYRTINGEKKSLLDSVRSRGRWPDSKNRYCTSEFKRGPGGRVITKLFKESPGHVLNVYGFRAQESPARAMKKVLARNDRFSTKRKKGNEPARREVFDWLPIHDLTETEVWQNIRESGVPFHKAYSLGMPRLSCVFCWFAPRNALILAGIHNPQLLDEYCDTEKATGHTFKNRESLTEIREAIRNGEQPLAVDGNWNM